MSLKRLVVTTTLDPSKPSMLSQGALLCGVIKECLEELSGRELIVTPLGNMRVKGSSPIVQKCQVEVVSASPRDNWEDRMRGSDVGLQVLYGNLQTAIDAKLTALFPADGSAILDLGTSLDRALPELPFGLIIDAGTPDVPNLIFSSELTSDGNNASTVLVDEADLGTGVSADVSWTQTGVGQEVSTVEINSFFPEAGTHYLSENFLMERIYPYDAGDGGSHASFKANLDAATGIATLEKAIDAGAYAPVSWLADITSGTYNPATVQYARIFISIDGWFYCNIQMGGTGWVRNSVYVDSAINQVFADATGSITLDNQTGVVIPNTTKVANLQFEGQALQS